MKNKKSMNIKKIKKKKKYFNYYHLNYYYYFQYDFNNKTQNKFLEKKV